MPIKIKTTQEAKKEKDFPKIMEYTGKDLNPFLVLFNKSREGTVIKSDHYPTGLYITSWAMHQFKDYNQPITLQNEE